MVPTTPSPLVGRTFGPTWEAGRPSGFSHSRGPVRTAGGPGPTTAGGPGPGHSVQPRWPTSHYTRLCSTSHAHSPKPGCQMSPRELHSLLSHCSSARAYAPSCSLPNRLAMTSRFGEAQRSATGKVAHSQSRALGICSRFARAGHSKSLQKQIAL